MSFSQIWGEEEKYCAVTRPVFVKVLPFMSFAHQVYFPFPLRSVLFLLEHEVSHSNQDSADDEF